MLGFLRETSEAAKKAGIDKQTGIKRSGLNEYLEIIFPRVKWIHDKPLGKINGINYKCRPDYRSDELMMIVEFDGTPHYTSPDQIGVDWCRNETYNDLGYKVVRIPYFIQLTKSAIKTLFDVNIDEKDVFPDNIPSLGGCKGDPSYLCFAGLERMANDFKRFPDQYKTNLKNLKRLAAEDGPGDFLYGAELLESFYNNLQN